MTVRGVLSVAALTALVPFLVACGGGSQNAAEPLPTAPTLTVPGDAKTPTITKTTETTGSNVSGSNVDTTTTPATTPTTTQANPSTPAGGASPPQTGGATPDTQQNDQAPPANSPASKFEQFCKENPGAC
jgi:hypothetical protein